MDELAWSHQEERIARMDPPCVDVGIGVDAARVTRLGPTHHGRSDRRTQR
jgi:hypothetical protein